MTALLTEDLKRAAPSMANIGRLRTAWMNGIQFYLARRAPIVHGHIVYVDSPWALTSVSQDQFWQSIDLSEYGDGEVKGILSVDISDWETPGMLYGKPAKECDPVEIKNEVVAHRRIAQHRAPQPAIVRVVTVLPGGNADSDFSGQPAALECVVDAFACEGVGESAGIADHVDREAGVLKRKPPTGILKASKPSSRSARGRLFERM
jgi:hypothetical protein